MEKKISRLSLLEKTKQYYQLNLDNKTTRYYYSKQSKINFIVSFETRKLIFELFKKSFEDYHFLTKIQVKEARRICNNLLIDLPLTPFEEEWFCENVSKSEMILNRLLRYPKKVRNNIYLGIE